MILYVCGNIRGLEICKKRGKNFLLHTSIHGNLE